MRPEAHNLSAGEEEHTEHDQHVGDHTDEAEGKGDEVDRRASDQEDENGKDGEERMHEQILDHARS